MWEAQQLLEESISSQQRADKQRLLAFAGQPGRWSKTMEGWSLVFNAEDADWFLQVLNDIRIGCWMRLGSPGYGESRQPLPGIDRELHYWAMEASGTIQSQILQVLQSGGN